MQKHQWLNVREWLAGVGLVLISATFVWAGEAPETPVIPQVRIGPLGVEVEMPRPSEDWIGLACLPVGEALRAQLKLDQGQGLLVQNVMADAPAAEAGIEQYDVLVAAGGKPLAKVQDLMDAVDEAEQKKLTLELYRGGKLKKVDVTPIKRPEKPTPPQADPTWREQYRDAWQQYLDRIRPGEEGKPPMQFRFFHPGTVVPQGKQILMFALPGDMSVRVTKEGDKPAKIEVTKGDESWEVTEDALGELPDEVRPHVERHLGKSAPGAGRPGEPMVFDFFPDWPRRGRTPDGTARPNAGEERPLEKQMEEMRRQLQEMREEMRKSIEELRESRPRLRDSDQDEKKTQKKV